MVKRFFYALCLGMVLASCGGDDPDEPKPPVKVEQTVLMYVPWAGGGSIYNACIKNISAMQTAIAYEPGLLSGKRFLVLIASTQNRAHLIELKYDDGDCRRDTLNTYMSQSASSYTTVEGIAAMFHDVMDVAPAASWGLIVGGHGMGWLPPGSVASAKQADVSWNAPVMPLPSHTEPQAAAPRFQRTFIPEHLETRYFGTAMGGDARFQTEVKVLAEALRNTFLHTDYILFDDCYMQNIETAYDLKDVTDFIIASPTEVMMVGMPYASIGDDILSMNYQGIVDGFYDYYVTYKDPYGTLSVLRTSEIDAMADLMKEANALHTFVPAQEMEVQPFDAYTPTIFFDMGSYLSVYCHGDESLLSRINSQMERLLPYKRHTPLFYSNHYKIQLKEYSGITISDPSHASVANTMTSTSWWKATH